MGADALRHGVHMTDMKALFTQRFEEARTALAQGDEPAAAESFHWAIVAARTDPNLRRELASALFHLGKLSRNFGRAGETEAEQLLTEALAISEELFGVEHSALVPLLNELTRLHVHLSQHARAEHALERLLAIARAKGEENADVALALAGLAVVKRKLGDEAAAEALYRDALRIREKVLEPGHIVTVATLEQLSETCAARGNFAEALTLLRRALATREVALGPGHATVQAARSRIAEFELQVAIAADAAAVAAARAARGPIPTPVWIKGTPESPAKASPAAAPKPIKPPPAKSDELEFLGESEPKTRTAPRPRERAKTPAVAAAVAAASLMASPMQTPSAPMAVISPPESAGASGTVTGRESGIAHRDAAPVDVAHEGVASGDVVLSDAPFADVPFADVALGEQESSLALVHGDSAEPPPKKRTALYASAGVAAAAAIAFAALMLRPSAGRGGKPVPTEQSAAPRTGAGAPVVTAAALRTGPAATGAAAVVGATHADSLRSANTKLAPTAPPVVRPEQRAPESASPELHAPRVQIHLDQVNISNAPNLDSLVRSGTERPRAADTERTTTAGTPVLAPTPASAPAPADVDAPPPTPPKIIGRPPEPHFPDALLRAGRRDGQVVVTFVVNEFGRAEVATMSVVKSDHDLFTAAVRDILPDFRFEPARTRTREAKAVSAWVSVPFRFTTKK